MFWRYPVQQVQQDNNKWLGMRRYLGLARPEERFRGSASILIFRNTVRSLDGILYLCAMASA
jgi:hypothetical protein